MNYFDTYEKAERFFDKIRDKTYSEQIEIIDTNKAASSDDECLYMWEVVRCKAKAANKGGIV